MAEFASFCQNRISRIPGGTAYAGNAPDERRDTRSIIRYRSVDLDGADYRSGDWGGEFRKALVRRTGAVTIPQIFVGGHHIGGATETFDAFNSAELRRQFEALEISMEPGAIPDAYRFLPSWLHPR